MRKTPRPDWSEELPGRPPLSHAYCNIKHQCGALGTMLQMMQQALANMANKKREQPELDIRCVHLDTAETAERCNWPRSSATGQPGQPRLMGQAMGIQVDQSLCTFATSEVHSPARKLLVNRSCT